jgi:hypothetical protein
MTFNILERIEYIKGELVSNRHDGWTTNGLKEELKKLEDQLKQIKES